MLLQAEFVLPVPMRSRGFRALTTYYLFIFIIILLLASCSQSLSTVIWYVPMCPNISSPCFVLQSLPNHTPKI